ncbi:MAG: peptide-methionine (R)-S-oxide reductase MsrB [Pseudomonadales bacterium]|nr:peptide-methionine (R)-S-oxide reductase MsrB [Pseudomonadales bacterium]HAO56222.1 peptide-methionine (R)-S-oxide reductase [Gammaproteobacteria bacterium]|tara:strand:- start:183 stop:581 length:399 start_codon:yes stop_codon:yes gene_type:complete
MGKIDKTNEEWREQLTESEFHITREAGTEMAFSGQYWDTKTKGIYNCRCCGEPLFDSESKYDSGCGWPSFYETLDKDVVETREDRSMFMVRTEVICSKCDAHLGHVFPDGPHPTGLRFCMNSASLALQEENE